MAARTLKQVLTIAGSDSGGGAGIQADLKSMSANGVFAMSVITAVTAQNTEDVTDVFELPTSIIASQLDAVFDDFEVSAVKTGMLSSTAIVELVAKMLAIQKVTNLVVDPVMVSKSGRALLKPDAIDALKKLLFPLALVVTHSNQARSSASQLSGASAVCIATGGSTIWRRPLSLRRSRIVASRPGVSTKLSSAMPARAAIRLASSHSLPDCRNAWQPQQSTASADQVWTPF